MEKGLEGCRQETGREPTRIISWWPTVDPTLFADLVSQTLHKQGDVEVVGDWGDVFEKSTVSDIETFACTKKINKTDLFNIVTQRLM